MTDFIVLLSAIIFGFVMGQIFFALKIRKTIQKMAKELNIDLNNVEKDILNLNKNVKVIKVTNLVTESTANSILLYNKDTGDFVAQANNVQELAENVYKFNKINFATVDHDEKLLWFVEGKVCDDLKEI